MSVANLAARLDALDAGGAVVAEAERSVAVSRLEAATAIEVLQLAEALDWPAHIFDAADSEWTAATIDDAFGPFQVVIDKPEGPANVLRLLTNVGFGEWLGRDDARSHWQVARLTGPISAQSLCVTGWDADAVEPLVAVARRSPRTLVREYLGQRSVPQSLGRWLLREGETARLEDASASVWARAAALNLMLALPDEYDSERQMLRFKGPPRLDLQLPADQDIVAVIEAEGFAMLQMALQWVFEVERETEMRHILLATEVARCGGSGEQASPFLRENLGAAFEGARTAYQIQLAGLSSDTLKSLAELRKSVTDETAKVIEATRQIIAAVAGALAVGVGLIAARITTTTNPWLIAIVMAIAGIYVAITIHSGISFMYLQREVRLQWQPRLYRFLSKHDYETLVSNPAAKAEGMLKMAAKLGGLAVALTAAAIFFVPPADAPKLPGGSTQSIIKTGGDADKAAEAAKDKSEPPVAPLAAPARPDEKAGVPPKAAK